MSFLAPQYYTTEPNYSGLFRLINDFDKYAAENPETNKANNSADGNQISRRFSNQLQSFKPKFDVKETETTYVLHGELPGVEKKDVNIEFTDEQTIRIHGKIERSYANEAECSSTNGNGQSKEVEKTKDAPKVKYWVSERSVGEFSRSFSFPGDVDHDGVVASLREGILYVAVPKARKVHNRKSIIVN